MTTYIIKSTVKKLYWTGNHWSPYQYYAARYVNRNAVSDVNSDAGEGTGYRGKIVRLVGKR